MLNTNFAPWPNFTIEESQKIASVLRSNQVNYWTGEECKLFEKEFASYLGVSHSISVFNGTVALDAALSIFDLKAGDEILVTSRTFIASASSIVNAGAKPVFVDVDLDSQNIDPNCINEAITDKTRGIICVHLAGWPCDMDKIMSIAKSHQLFVIEDCAQAHGGTYKGKPLGSIGDIACWSFCQDKIISTGGEGGMITTNDKKLWEKLWSMKDHGKSFKKMHTPKKDNKYKWCHDSIGTNYRMTEIQAAIGRIQLRRLDKMSAIRRRYQKKIWAAAANINGIRVPKYQCSNCSCSEYEACKHAAYKCYIFIEKKKIKGNWSRDRILSEINQLGVPCSMGTCSEVYLEKAFKDLNIRPKNRLPNAKLLGETSMMFLVHPTLSNNEIELTCHALEATMKKATK